MEKWLHELIRKIPPSSYTTGVESVVAMDIDNIKALCTRVYDNKRNVVFGHHFNIEWIVQDEKRVDWLGQILGSAFQAAYDKGKQDSELATAAALTGFKELLNRA